MRVGLLSREFPPDVYGGAGVHVEFLARELARLVDLDVHSWGEGRSDGVLRHRPWSALDGANDALRTFSVDLAMTAALEGRELVHSHTWYANLGGHLAKLLHGVPHVMTAHSLEPLRPWKAEQLGGGYSLSGWAERTAIEAADAVIAVSGAMREDILGCYPAWTPPRSTSCTTASTPGSTGPTTAPTRWTGSAWTAPAPTSCSSAASPARRACPTCCARYGTSTRPRRSCCARALRTPPRSTGSSATFTELSRAREGGTRLIPRMLPRPEVIQLLTHAAVFVCPSVY
ncbi:glycogen synthase [Streptomyces violaceorubidus]